MKQKITHLLLSFLITGSTLVGQNNQSIKQSLSKTELNNDFVIDNNYSRSLSKNKQTSTSYGRSPGITKFSDFGGSGSDYINDITSDDKGNIYVTGKFSGDLTIEGTLYTSVGDYDSFIAKYDSNNNGKLIWFKQIPSSNNNVCISNAITLDNDGGVYITGTYSGSLKLGNKILPNANSYNLFYAYFDNYGTIINSAFHNKSVNERGVDIITDSNNNIYITASTSVSTDLSHQSWILKYNTDATLTSEAFYEVGFNNLIIKDQSILYTGVTSNGDNSSLNNGIIISTPNSYNDVFIAKSDLNLNFEWVVAGLHTNDSNGDSMSGLLDIDDLGNVYVVGTYRHNLTLGDFSITEGYYGSSFVTKIDIASGYVLWLKSIRSDNISIDVHDNTVYLLKENDTAYNLSLNGDILSENTFSSSFYNMHIVNGNYIMWSKEGISIYLTQFSNSFVQSWKTYLTGTSSYSTTVGTVVDNKGNVYNCFTTSGNIDYNGVQLNKGTVLTKLDKLGNLIWLKQFPKILMTRQSIGNFIDIDTINHNLVITNRFTEELQIPGGPTLSPLESGSIFISKFDLDGNHIWSTQENFNSGNPTIDVDINGNIYLTSTFFGDLYIGDTSYSSKNSTDAFIAKYSKDGNYEWSKHIGGIATEYNLISTSDSEGYIYLAGEFISEEIVFGDITFSMLEGEGNIFVAKIDSDGDIIWNKTIAGGPDNRDLDCWPTGIITDNRGNLFIKGWLGNNNMFDDIHLTSDYFYNKFLTQINVADGSVNWAKPILETSYSFCYNSFSVDKEGSVYLGSEVRGDQIFFGSDFTYSKVGERDAFVAKYLGNGTLDWVKTIQSSSYITISSVSIQGVDNLVISGDFNGNLSFENKSIKSVSTHSFITFLGDNLLNIEDAYNKTENIVVYPNPTIGNISIKPNNLDYNKIEIIDLSGIVIRTITRINNSGLYDLSNLTKGIYILKVYSNENTYSQQLIIE